ncbi:hypothetical protein C8J57DRAFT_1463942 [Mycena rebaudengoi]|nr:hypothetical protein C8J57DRAFT_1463942 [Mycena rebaudengoi]
MPQQQYYFWCLDPATCRNILVGLDPGTQISIASGAWNQLPSECMDPDTRKNIRGSGNQKQYSGRYPHKYYFGNITVVWGTSHRRQYSFWYLDLATDSDTKSSPAVSNNTSQATGSNFTVGA